MDIYSPYTYLIGWSQHDKWYYGVQTKKHANLNDLWVRYFTSSNIVKAFRKIYGEPDIIQVRRLFTDRASAIKWEIKVLERMKVTSSDKWLNQRIVYMDGSTSNKHWMKTEAGQKLLKDARRQWRIDNPDRGSWNKGLTKDSHQSLREASIRAKEHQKSGQICCIGDSMRGRVFDEEHKNKLRTRALLRKKTSCQHCNVLCTPGMFARWHGENCRSKSSALAKI